ncbi:MAG: HupE/UreJ family protein [Phycisphaerales bacterium]|nr:HupE/UreJ family protein [Phycisphaerales bacterium]
MKVDSQGRGTLTIRFDVPPFALNEEPFAIADEPMWAWVDGPREEVERLLRDSAGRLTRRVQVRADGAEVPIELRSFPSVADFERWKQNVRGPDEKPRLPWMAEAVIGFEVPASQPADEAGVVRLSVRLPEVLGDIVLAVEVPGAEAQAFVLKAGESSPESSVQFASSGGQEVGDRKHEEPQTALGFFSFVRMGAEHVVPDGLDHMLFILGLYLASPRLKSLLILVTMFTLAHSVTLTLAATGLVVAPPRLIEPAIALSIVAVAIENLVTRPRSADGGRPRSLSLRQDAVRAAIVFAFGLVHGLGFASAFGEMQLPGNVLVPALVGFNVGVEVGQLLVLCGAFVVVGWAARKPWYRKVVVIPGSAAIACVGLYWAVTRAI